MRSFVSLCLTACVLKHIMACKCTGGGRYDPPPQRQEIKHLSWQAGIHMKDFALRFEEQIPSVDRHYLINFQWQHFGLSKRPYMQAINGNYPSKKFSRCADGDADWLFWFACLRRGTAKNATASHGTQQHSEVEALLQGDKTHFSGRSKGLMMKSWTGCCSGWIVISQQRIRHRLTALSRISGFEIERKQRKTCGLFVQSAMTLVNHG